jgi:hypothetical protein
MMQYFEIQNTLASSAYIATDVSFIDSAKGTILKKLIVIDMFNNLK